MYFINIFLLFCFLLCTTLSEACRQYTKFRHLLPRTSIAVQESALRDLIQRTIGQNATHHFDIIIDPTCFRYFKLQKTTENKVLIIGSDGVSAAKAFHYYLKYYLHKDISWTDTEVNLPLNISLPDVNVSSDSASDFIYYQNVCTWSYTFAWWDFSTWRKHIDWMAMQGISLTIAPIQEQIWYDLYIQMGLTEQEISDYFAGPAFQAWQRMGNIRGWAGPISSTYRRMQQLLQKQIIQSLQALGISVALPAFAGHVPVSLQRLFPNTNFTAVERWNQFPNKYCCSLFLDPNDILFQDIGAKFLKNIISVYGTNHIYFADPFNEIQPQYADENYMNLTAHHIYSSMSLVDNEAVWLLQGWMFVKNVFWTDDLIKAFLTAVPNGNLLVLDLQSEQFPQYERTYSFHGQPFIWCMLHNFGGTLGMHGSVNIINTKIREARNMLNSTMIGVGITPEGIYQNYAMYALTLERGWQLADFDLTYWFNTYADVRYGIMDPSLRSTWQILRNSVYSYYGIKKMRGKYAITRRPSLNLDIWTWYNASSIHQAWVLMLAANASVPENHYHLYEYDLVDITRQFLQTMADRLYINLISAYKKQELDRFTYIANKLILLFDDLENILSTNNGFLLGSWLESAKMMGENSLEKRLYEFNARNQITAWGPTGQILDYATKQWSGIVNDYYKPRWNLFINLLKQSLMSKTKFNSTYFKEIVSNEIENPFSVQLKKYPTKGTGISYKVSRYIFNNWTVTFDTAEFLNYLRLFVKLI